MAAAEMVIEMERRMAPEMATTVERNDEKEDVQMGVKRVSKKRRKWY